MHFTIPRSISNVLSERASSGRQESYVERKNKKNSLCEKRASVAKLDSRAFAGPSQALRRPFAGNPAQNIFFWRRPVSCSRELMMLQWWTWLQPKYSNRGTYSTLAFCIEIWWKLDELRYVNMPNMKDNCSDFHRKINLHLLNDIAFITYPTLAFCIEIWMKIKWNMLP